MPALAPKRVIASIGLFDLQVSMKVLSIGEREELLREGLADRNQGVQKVVEKELGKYFESLFLIKFFCSIGLPLARTRWV